MSQCSRQQPPPFQLNTPPDEAVAAVCHHLTTPSCPGPCRLAPVCRTWGRTSQQHLAAATVQLRLGRVVEWEDKQLQQRRLQEQQQLVQAQPLQPSAGPAKGKNRMIVGLMAVRTPRQRLQGCVEADQQRLASLVAWLQRHGPFVGGLSITLEQPPHPISCEVEAYQQAVTSYAAGVSRVVNALIGAAAAAAAAAAETAVTLAEQVSAGEQDTGGCRALATSTSMSATAAAAGGPPSPSPPAAAANAAGGSSAGGLQLRTLRLGVGGRPLPPIGRVLAASPHLVSLRLDQWREGHNRDWPCAQYMAQQLAGALQQLPHLTALHVWSGWLSETEPAAWGVRAIPAVLHSCPSSLEVLVVTGPAPGWMWQDLGHLTRLRQLQIPADPDPEEEGLYDEDTSAAAATAAAGLTRLTALECGAALTAGGALLQLPSLVALGTLAEADAEEPVPRGPAMRQLVEVPTLRRLTLFEPGCEEVLAVLGQLTQLEELSVRESYVLDDLDQEPQPPSAWRDALGALTRPQRLTAPIGLLLGEEGSDSPLGQLQQLRVVHAVGAPSGTQVRQLLQALAGVSTLQEVRLNHVRGKEAKAAWAAAQQLLPRVQLVVNEKEPVGCSVVEEVLG